MVFSFVQVTEQEPKVNPKKASQGRWWTVSQIEESPQEIFTSNFCTNCQKLKLSLGKSGNKTVQMFVVTKYILSLYLKWCFTYGKNICREIYRKTNSHPCHKKLETYKGAILRSG